jgi:SAM-dependent methyltransferase
VVEVGCGDGALTRSLRDAGFEVVGIDPEAPVEPGFLRCTLEAWRPARSFDAAIAVRSLHHLDDLELAVDNLAGALHPRSRLVLFEFAKEALDERAARWLDEHQLRAPVSEHAEDVISLEHLRAALGRRFEPLAEEPAPYMAREAGRPELEAGEWAAIEAGELRASGRRLAYARR